MPTLNEVIDPIKVQLTTAKTQFLADDVAMNQVKTELQSLASTLETNQSSLVQIDDQTRIEQKLGINNLLPVTELNRKTFASGVDQTSAGIFLANYNLKVNELKRIRSEMAYNSKEAELIAAILEYSGGNTALLAVHVPVRPVGISNRVYRPTLLKTLELEIDVLAKRIGDIDPTLFIAP